MKGILWLLGFIDTMSGGKRQRCKRGARISVLLELHTAALGESDALCLFALFRRHLAPPKY